METLTIPALAAKVPTEAAAWKYMERLRWKGHPVCPHCGVIDGHYLIKNKNRTTTTGAKTARRMWKCCSCRKQFSVLVGTIAHGSKVPVRTWLFVIVEMCASKNGIAAREVQRKYGLTAKTAWFLTQRVREAMVDRKPDALVGTIVADETYIGGQSRPVPANVPPGQRKRWAAQHRSANKTPVFTILNRETGVVRSRVMPNVTADSLSKALMQHVDVDRSRLFTDEHWGYRTVGGLFGLGHESVNHNDHEYVRGEVTTNHVEQFFSQLKRSIDGTFHAVSSEHLDRYLAEFDFRYCTRKASDSQRADMLIGQMHGRLTWDELTGQAA